MAALTHLLDLIAPLGFPLVLLALAAGAVWLIRYHPVGAVARNTIRQAIRVKAAFAIMVLYLVLVVAIPFVVRGDNTLRGQLHVVISYSFIAAGVLLGILTLAMSTTALWSEVHEKQIFVVESKPISRWQVLAGKLLGILTIDAALLAFMALVTWGCVQWLVSRPRWEQMARYKAEDQVLTARRVVRPEPVDVAARVEQALAELKRRGQMPEERTEEEVREDLRQRALALYNALRPRAYRHWHFTGLKYARREDRTITLRFQFACSDTAASEVRVGWEIGDPNTRWYARPRGAYAPEEVHEEQIAANFIAPDGTLDVRLYNIDPRGVILVFSGEDAMEVLVPMAGFASNLARGLWLVFIELVFLAVLGLVCSTFLSFPVSPVVALSVYLLIFLASAMQRELNQGLNLFENKAGSAVTSAAEQTVRGVIVAIRHVLPPFDKYSAGERVSAGEEVSWFLVLDATFWIGLVRGGLLMLIGVVVFERRELALAAR
ncbi:MAG: ABC transporter permease [Planctomycetota bacterium]